MNQNTLILEKNGYILRLSKENDAEEYYQQNFNLMNVVKE